MNSVASARRAFAVSMGKAVRDGSRRLGKGNGSAVPGAVAMAIDPGMLAGLASEIPQGAVLVTGSNGKGTTCRLLAGAMRAAGLHPILNREGSNQLSGLATTLVASSGRFGHLPADDRAIGLFEVDEGSFPGIVSQMAGRARWSSPTSSVISSTGIWSRHTSRRCSSGQCGSCPPIPRLC